MLDHWGKHLCGDSNSGGGDNNECDYEDGSVVRSVDGGSVHKAGSF